MKKNEFVSLVAERTDMSKKDTEKVSHHLLFRQHL